MKKQKRFGQSAFFKVQGNTVLVFGAEASAQKHGTGARLRRFLLLRFLLYLFAA
jgi:hypothetical protein